MLIVGLLAAVMVAGSGLSTTYLLTRDKIPTEVLDVLEIENKPEVEETDVIPTPTSAPPALPPQASSSGGDSSDSTDDDNDDDQDQDSGADSSSDSSDADPTDSSSDSSDDYSSQEDQSTQEQDLPDLIKRLLTKIDKNHVSWTSKATLGGTYEMHYSITELISALEAYKKQQEQGTSALQSQG